MREVSSYDPSHSNEQKPNIPTAKIKATAKSLVAFAKMLLIQLQNCGKVIARPRDF
jgi:hypothetical protein